MRFRAFRISDSQVSHLPSSSQALACTDGGFGGNVSEGNCLLKRLAGLREFLLIRQGVAEIRVGPGESGLAREDLAVGLLGLGQATQCTEGISQMKPEIEVRGLKREAPPVESSSFRRDDATRSGRRPSAGERWRCRD